MRMLNMFTYFGPGFEFGFGVEFWPLARAPMSSGLRYLSAA